MLFISDDDDDDDGGGGAHACARTDISAVPTEAKAASDPLEL